MLPGMTLALSSSTVFHTSARILQQFMQLWHKIPGYTGKTSAHTEVKSTTPFTHYFHQIATRLEPFVAETDKQMSQDLHTVGHVTCQAQQKPNWYLFTLEQSLASEVPTGTVTATKPEQEESKREPRQVADRDFHGRVKEELTTEPGLGIREMHY